MMRGKRGRGEKLGRREVKGRKRDRERVCERRREGGERGILRKRERERE
jgi:hypothetical protein